ncbi:MAG: 8-oxoguanine deaminase [Actinobacteria bacterium]|nr:8-oxoguanine deaminase [Actinomycetota bacterium]
MRLILTGTRWPGDDIAIEDGRIAARGEVRAREGDRIIHCEGDIITPGLVNTHHHLYQWMTRGRATGCDLFGWLKVLYPIWARMDTADIRAAALTGLGELALSGATTVADHHYIVPRGDDSVFYAIADAAREVGVRLVLSRGSMDLGESNGGLPPDDIVEDTEAVLASTESVASNLHDGDMTTVVVAPCSPFSVTPELMETSAVLARTLGLRLHTHLAETVSEERDCQARYGRRPLEVMEELGWVGQDVWFAHGIHFNPAEIQRLGTAGVGVAHCPSSNGRLASGFCPVVDLRSAGVPVGLGVDGAASNESGALFPEIRQAVYLARLREGRPDALSPEEGLEMATVGGAKCIGRPELGTLEVGSPADIAVWPGGDLEDVEDALAGLVLGPDRRVRHLFVGGRMVVEDGMPVGFNLDASHRELARRAKRLFASD